MLYGDGIHDDTAAIQELLDTRRNYIELPPPAVFYLISRTLKIHSNQELRLPRYCHIVLAPNSNCYMITNADVVNGNENITISGGIWDYNNKKQKSNPAIVPHIISISKYECSYNGISAFFYHVNRLVLHDITFKDPVTYACTLDTVSYFTVANVVFDFNYGNPFAQNMDGIHMNGNCNHGLLQNLKGACYDDLVALNADEGSRGPITNIRISGIFAENCHSAVRLLTVDNPVEHIHISDIFGTFYTYCIGITKFCFERETTGYFDGLVFDNIHVSKAMLRPEYHKEEIYGIQPVVLIERETITKSLSISNLFRNECNMPVPTIGLQKNAFVDHFNLRSCFNRGRTDVQYCFVDNNGSINNLFIQDVYNENGDIWNGNQPKNRNSGKEYE